MNLSAQPAQQPMSDAINTGSAYLNILLTLIPSKSLFATLVFQSKISGYDTDGKALPVIHPMTMKRLLLNGASSTRGREYVIKMPSIFHNAFDLKFWR